MFYGYKSLLLPPTSQMLLNTDPLNRNITNTASPLSAWQDGTNQTAAQCSLNSRPRRRWADDLVDWCNKDICTLCGLASDNRWSRFIKYVIDTNGH